MRTIQLFSMVLALCVLISFSTLVYADAAYFAWLGNLYPGQGVALAVSDDGSTAVGYTGYPDTERAFRWNLSSGMVELANQQSRAYDVDGNGHPAVGVVLNSGVVFAFGGYSGIGDLPGGSDFSQAFGISADGLTVVGWSGSGGGNQAFRWTSTTGMVTLPSVAGNESQATKVAPDGTKIVGYRRYNAGGTNVYEAFLWCVDNTRYDLGDLPGGEFFSVAEGISADGTVVIGRSKDELGDEKPFMWTAGAGMAAILPGPGSGYYDAFGVAYGVSGDGRIIVGVRNVTMNVGFIWDCIHGSRSLQSVLVSEFGLDIDGGTIGAAYDISADGRTIVGTGSHSGGLTEPWIARLPCRKGDVNSDGRIDGRDVEPFVHTLVDPNAASVVARCAADLHVDSQLDAADLSDFIAMLLCC